LIAYFATNYAFTSNQVLTAKLRNQALKDELTELANRRAMRQNLFKEMARSQRTGRPTSLLMIDIDYFKQINDVFGHDVGDQALKWLAEVFNETLRGTDLASRWGGEEFLILLPETDIKQAYFVANRIRESIEDQNLPNCTQEVHFTVSCGIANTHAPHKEPITDIDFLTNIADENLYKAKNNGRNRVEPSLTLTQANLSSNAVSPL
jgi:diguanylate cyclase (GGDEF)-like protein